MIALPSDLKVVLAAQVISFGSRCIAYAVGAGERTSACEPVLRRHLRVPQQALDSVKLLAWDDNGLVLVRK